MVNICEVLEHLIEEFEQINNKDFKIYYVKVALPAKSSETDRKKVWSELWGDDESRSWPEYTQYPLFEREEDAKPSHIVYGALRDTNVTEGWQAIEGSIKKTVRQLLLRNYEPESMPDSDTFLDNFPKFTDTKVPIQQQGGKVYLWYELLLKLSQEQGAFIEGDLGLSGLCMSELPCATKIQGLKTDVLTASKLALQYLLDKAEQRSRQKEFTGADRNNLSQEKPVGTGEEIKPAKKPHSLEEILIAVKKWRVAGQNNQEGSETAQLLGTKAMQLITENLELLMVCLNEYGGSLKTKNALSTHLAMVEGMRINNDLSFENMGGYNDYHLFAQDAFINELNRWAKKLEAKQGNNSVKEPKADNVFKKTGDIWTVKFQGNTKHITDSVGLSYIKLLLSHKGDTFTTAEFLSLYNDKPVTLTGGDNQLDDEGKEKYKERLTDIEYRLEEAKNNNDVGTQEKLEDEKATIIAELSTASFGRHNKKLNPEYGKYRLSTGNAIVRAIKKIEKHIPELAEHLRDAIPSLYSSTSLSYRPSKPTNWAL